MGWAGGVERRLWGGGCCDVGDVGGQVLSTASGGFTPVMMGCTSFGGGGCGGGVWARFDCAVSIMLGGGETTVTTCGGDSLSIGVGDIA